MGEEPLIIEINLKDAFKELKERKEALKELEVHMKYRSKSPAETYSPEEITARAAIITARCAIDQLTVTLNRRN